MTLRPWARGPFELIVHGELHYRAGNDFDRRVALISFDNAIEVAITTYLGLHPLHRGNREYKNDDRDRWLKDFHTKLDFLFSECDIRGIDPLCDQADLVFYHRQRNDQYHNGRLSAPDVEVLSALREAAIWTFHTLYEVDNIDLELEDQVRALKGEGARIEPQKRYDRALDEKFGYIEVAGIPFRTSEALLMIDPSAYVEQAEIAIAEAANGQEQ